MTPVAVDERDYAYSVHYQGRVDGVMGKSVDLYKATYDPLRFVPYAFIVLFLLGAVIHYAVKVRCKLAVPKGDKLLVLPFAVILAALPMEARASERAIPIWEALHSDTAMTPYTVA